MNNAWTTAHVTSSAGGVDFGARAIAGYYDGLWARILGASHRTRVWRLSDRARFLRGERLEIIRQ